MGTTRTLYLRTEDLEIIRDNNLNVSEFFHNSLEQAFMQEEETKIRLRKAKARVKKIEKELELITQRKNLKKKSLSDLSLEMIKVLIDMNKKLKEDPNYFTGMFRRFRIDYMPEITRSEFINLLDKYKPKNEKIKKN